MTRFGLAFVGALLSTTALTSADLALAQESQAPAAQNTEGEASDAVDAPEAEAPSRSSDGLEEIVVRGRYIPEPKRETSEIASFISAEDLSRQGDSNIAESLRRVTGLSLVGGKYIYVRGLGERYSNANLNGLPLPSPEPLRRVVPLDLFPTGVLESAAAQKTFSPQYSGEFGGGVIDIRTKAVPDERVIEAGVSLGGNTETTFKRGLTYDGGSHDWLGFDSGIREIPGPLRDAIASGKRVNNLNFTDQQLQLIGRSLINSELWVQFEEKIPANFSVEGTYGDRFLRGDTSLGFLFSGGYNSSWRTKRGKQQNGRFGTNAQGQRALLVADDYNLYSTQNDIRWHALLSGGAEWGDNEVKLTSLYVRTTTKEARTLDGIAAQFGLRVRQDFLEWFERQLWTNQLAGTHRFEGGDVQLDWKTSYSMATRDAPYERSVQYRDFGDGLLRYDFQQGRNLTRFSEIDDRLWSGALDLTWDTIGFDDKELTVKGGYLYTDTKRDSEQRDYRLVNSGGPLPDALLLRRLDFIFADQNVNPGRFVITEVTGSSAPPAYNGTLKVHGGYISADSEIVDYVRAALGMRYESGKQRVDTFDFYTPNTGVETQLDEDFWLPAATLTWNFAENMQVRIGASRTISRPQFRELAPAEFIDVDTDRKFVGNPFLVNSKIDNLDARWEWYFADQQFVTLGAFYKRLKNPIEETINEAGDNLQTTFQNAPRAELYGVEVEAKYILPRFEGEAWLARKEFYVSANYTFSESKLKVSATDIVVRQNGTRLPANFVIRDGRRLQGHSKHLANFEVGYTDTENNSSATLLLNYASKRIRSTAPQTLPEIIEKPPLSLDFTYKRPFVMFGGEHEFGLSIENITGSRSRASQEFGGTRVDVDNYPLGQSISMSLKRRF
jgi:outer membrane receptor protein involved in Fe transport